jgi:hypothetical protein
MQSYGKDDARQEHEHTDEPRLLRECLLVMLPATFGQGEAGHMR